MVQVITRDYGYISIAEGDCWSIGDTGILHVRDESGEIVAAFIQWIGVHKADS